MGLKGRVQNTYCKELLQNTSSAARHRHRLTQTCSSSLLLHHDPKLISTLTVLFFLTSPGSWKIYSWLMGVTLLPNPSPCLEFPSGSVPHCAHIRDASCSVSAPIGVRHDPNKTRSVQRSLVGTVQRGLSYKTQSWCWNNIQKLRSLSTSFVSLQQ